MTSQDHTAKMPASEGQSMDPGPAPATGALTAIDPVCGMTVTVTEKTRTAGFGGKDFHFCSDKCQTRFKADPWFYASGNAKKRGKVAAVGTEYTCPMHPQIVRDKPGSCPICGMALEPVLPSDRLCCTNPVRDSSRESSVVAVAHEQTHTRELQDQELALL